MAGVYTYTPAMWPPLLGGLFLAVIGLYSWRRRDVPGARWLVAGSAIGVFWLLGIALQEAAVGPATKLAWYRFQAAWHLPAVTTSTCFVLEYADPGRWLSWRRLAALWLLPLLSFLVVLIAPQLLWTWMEISPDGLVRTVRTIGLGVPIIYSLCLILVTTAAFLGLFIRSPLHRWPVALMLSGLLASYGLYVMDRAHLAPTFANLAIAAIVVMWSMQAIALFGFRIFDPLPAARQAVLEQMYAGVVAFDTGWRVLSLNPAAEMILGVRAALARGKTWQQLRSADRPLPALPDLETYRAAGVAELPDMTFRTGSAARQYTPALSTLTDFRGLPAGHLLMLHDVTEQRRADAEALELQRLQATLRERERLARELHDSIGQVFGFANLKLGAARKLMADGRLAKADDHLATLERIVAGAHGDLREYILNLRTGPAEERPFLAALNQYIDGYRLNYGIQVDLSVSAEIDEGVFSMGDQMQLFRIIQEALSNARKHAQADCVWVSFEKAAGPGVRIRIRDNGQGFDPLKPGEAGVTQVTGMHFGLSFMRERAEQLGGALRIDSAPGQGTCVEVEVPV